MYAFRYVQLSVHFGFLNNSYYLRIMEVSTEVFKQIKNVVVLYGKKHKGQRTMRRALMKKFPQITENQWKNTFPILWAKVGKDTQLTKLEVNRDVI